MAVYKDFEGTYEMMSREDCKAQMKKLNLEVTKEKVDRYYKNVMLSPLYGLILSRCC